VEETQYKTRRKYEKAEETEGNEMKNENNDEKTLSNNK